MNYQAQQWFPPLPERKHVLMTVKVTLHYESTQIATNAGWLAAGATKATLRVQLCRRVAAAEAQS